MASAQVLLDALREPPPEVFDIMGNVLDALPVSQCAALWGEIEHSAERIFHTVTKAQINTALVRRSHPYIIV